MKINRDVLIEFRQITSFDIESFFERSLKFLSREYNSIVSYYSGDTSHIDSSAIEAFKEVKNECSKVFETIQIHSRQLNNAKWWLLVEAVENVDSRLQTLSNMHRWSKSSRTRVAYDSKASVQYTLKQNQTLEKVSRDFLLSDNQEEWTNIAIDNNLREEDYTNEGGVDLRLKFGRVSNQGMQIDSVVDTMVGKSVYGKDLDKNLRFNELTQDLEVLGYDETVLQSVEILSTLKRGDNPEYPHQGLQSSIVIGSNKGTLNFPIITRQMTDVFQTDDSLRDFTIQSIKVDQDSLLIDYVVQTRLNETFSGQVTI